MTDKDLNFISKIVSLDKRKVSLLCEEESDLNLLVEGIINKQLTKKDYKGLSFSFYCKLIVFKETKKYKYELSEKNLVAGIISELYPRLKDRTNFKPFIRTITAEPNVKGAKYYFILSSLFKDRVNIEDPKEIQIAYISNGFKNLHLGLSKHVEGWRKILADIKNKGYLRVSITEKPILELEECPRYEHSLITS